jgi:hypothetical protein
VSIEVVPAIADHDRSCPVCGQSVSDAHDEAAAILRDLADLDSQLGDLRGLQQAVGDRQGQVEESIAKLRDELRGVTADIDGAVRASAELAHRRALRSQQDFLQGRISEFLAALPPSEDGTTAFEREVARLERLVTDLDEQLNPATFRERTESMLRIVSTDVTTWARRLDLGYSEHGIQIDPNSLTIVADTHQGPVELDRMGSAANAMGYHVTAHLALHKWFVEQHRPVPGFLILDQPSQVYFPDDVRRPEDEEISDEDRQRITALYELIRDVVATLGDRLQVIVLDHANLAPDWFQRAVVANWRYGDALVPAQWLGGQS